MRVCMLWDSFSAENKIKAIFKQFISHYVPVRIIMINIINDLNNQTPDKFAVNILVFYHGEMTLIRQFL